MADMNGTVINAECAQRPLQHALDATVVEDFAPREAYTRLTPANKCSLMVMPSC